MGNEAGSGRVELSNEAVQGRDRICDNDVLADVGKRQLTGLHTAGQLSVRIERVAALHRERALSELFGGSAAADARGEILECALHIGIDADGVGGGGQTAVHDGVHLHGAADAELADEVRAVVGHECAVRNGVPRVGQRSTS